MIKKEKKETSRNYTCNEYREEMILLGLRRQLQKPGISTDEKMKLRREIERLEQLVGF